ncbi:MAG: rod shape-determining protein MreC [Bacteroidales bacterium]|nr:rod shape-determining protein MreC [Bacteroidales bacterium]
MRNRDGAINTVILISVFVALEIVSIILITNSSIVQKYRIMGNVRSVQAYFWDKGNNIGRYFSLKEENDALIRENYSLRQQLTDLQNIETYQDSIGLNIERQFTLIPATIIKNSTNNQHNFLILNKGIRDGVTEGMGVISHDGVVGVINSVTDKFSHVISFLNTSQSISVKLANSNYYGPMRWDGVSTNNAIMGDVPLFCEAAPGDTVVTSGFSAIFPPNIPIGVVSDVESIGGLYKTLGIKLFQNYNSLSSVYIVTNRNIDEIKELEKKGGQIDE